MRNLFIHLLWLSILTVGLGACRKSDVVFDPVSKDKTKPGIVTNVKVANVNGGATITYNLPNSENILYILAKYGIGGTRTRETKSSYYTDTIRVGGFAKSQEYEVTLYTVSRANVMSDPVVVKVHPDTPYYELVKKHAQLTADFGGISVTSFNKGKTGLALNVLAMTDQGKYEAQDPFYTSRDTINLAIRGFDTKPRKFGLYVTDQYGNVSDTVVKTISPLFEVLLDKSKFSVYKLPKDAPIGYSWELYYFWDGKTDGTSNGWHTTTPSTYPLSGTFGLGQSAKISRFMLWERPDGSSYAYGNPQEFTLWGTTKDAPQDATLPMTSSIGTVVGDWINLGNFKYPDPPSGNLPGFATDADKAFVKAGVNFNMPNNSPATKFIRFSCSKTFGNVEYMHMMEISFYGAPQ